MKLGEYRASLHETQSLLTKHKEPDGYQAKPLEIDPLEFPDVNILKFAALPTVPLYPLQPPG
jgi:hypothetical protein